MIYYVMYQNFIFCSLQLSIFEILFVLDIKKKKIILRNKYMIIINIKKKKNTYNFNIIQTVNHFFVKSIFIY